MHAVQADRLRNLQKLNSKLNERFTKETQLVQIVDDQIHFSITSALSADDSRKAAFQLAFDEDRSMHRAFCVMLGFPPAFRINTGLLFISMFSLVAL